MTKEEDKPGKIRTWWHPLLAAFLRWQLGSHYEVLEEKPVGKKPLQIDVLLLLKEQGDLPERARQILAGLVEYLNDYTLVELKSPSDTLRVGDFQTLLGYTFLYRAQNCPTLHCVTLSTVPSAEHECSVFVAASQLISPGSHTTSTHLSVTQTWLVSAQSTVATDRPSLAHVSSMPAALHVLRPGLQIQSLQAPLPGSPESTGMSWASHWLPPPG